MLFSSMTMPRRCCIKGSQWPSLTKTPTLHPPLRCHPCHRPWRSLHIAHAVTDEDRGYIRDALDLARRGFGKTHPNPAVGCVIVKNNKIVGEGYHPKAGMPHAEVYALRAAGNEAQGATAYVTLEPCNHYGRTPPCSMALVDAAVARVVVGVTDPNPLVGGQGIATLRDAGIEVELVGGEEEAQCFEINRDFMMRMQQEAAQGS